MLAEARVVVARRVDIDERAKRSRLFPEWPQPPIADLHFAGHCGNAYADETGHTHEPAQFADSERGRMKRHASDGEKARRSARNLRRKAIVTLLLHRETFVRGCKVRALRHKAYGQYLNADAHLVHDRDALVDVGHRRDDRLRAVSRLRAHGVAQFDAFRRAGEDRMRFRSFINVGHYDMRMHVDESSAMLFTSRFPIPA